MKKFFILLILVFNSNITFAIEEVLLPKEEITPSESFNLDYLSDVYYARAENYEKVSPVFKLFSEKGLEFENSKINSIKASFLYGSNFTFQDEKHKSSSFKYNFDVVEPMITVKFNENKSKAMFDINLTRDLDGYSNSFTEKINRLYVSHDITPNQTILIGQGERIPNTFDGSISYMEQDTILKSQLGRTLGNFRAMGIRNKAKYKYADYDIGVYDSTRYMKNFGEGIEFSGNILIKPFAKFENEIKNLKIGAACNVGEYYNNYKQYSFFSGYDYKKFHIKAEYANADGYNAVVNSQNNADGFYSTASFDITPKISLLGRYDYFMPNKSLSSNIQEYTAGITYKPYKNMKIMLNYVRRNYSDKSDSNMLMFATRFII